MARPSKNRLLVSIAVILGVPSVAHAEPPRLETPSGAETCPSGADLRGAIAAQLGRDDFERPGAPRVVVRVRTEEAGTFAADVAVSTSSGHTSVRTIADADTCTDVVRAAALSVALAIEQDEEAKPPAAPPAPRDERPLAGGPQPPERFVATASALTSVGLLPRPSVGAGIGARVRVTEALWLSARGLWLPSAAIPNDAFALRLLAGGAGVCVEPLRSARVTGLGCGHVVVGSFEVSDARVAMQRTDAAGYVAASLSVGARARIVGPFHVEGMADAHLPFTRPTYLTATCPPSGFEPPFAALALWLGAGLSI